MYISLDEMKRASELTREGRLLEATRIIRQALGETSATQPASPGAAEVALPPGQHASGDSDISDVEFRELPPSAHEVAPLLLPQREAARAQPDRFRPASFEAHRFASNGRTHAYRLYVPPRSDDRLLPVIVMLHGCTQDAADFAAGTAMNELAAQRGCIVVYPEQLARSNSMRCWNWFDPSHQHRGRGEPAMIAALAADVVQRCEGDPSRVYVAGLSAGGAMAALVAQLYPDVFAAVGVHSGVPAGAATDVPSAHVAMRRPARKPGAGATSLAVVPTIVFHGDSDRTVHPDNGCQLIAEAVARATVSDIELQPQEQCLTLAGRTVKRTIYHDPLQVPRLEHWEIADGTHAWSGGSADGSYTDPSGPSASAAMIDFFLAQQLAPDAVRST
ncbi:PHB depolymerase family esterase [Ramlibacter monticola]|nr:PHB depolymerase family esterase [Ramlibacter monticola]